MNKLNQLLRQSVVIGAVVLLAAVFVVAQQARGTLRGLVKDELGRRSLAQTVTVIEIPVGTRRRQ